MNTIAQVIDLWPSLGEFAADVGVSYGVAKQWRRRNSVPGERWAAIVDAAENRGLVTVSLETLAAIARTRVNDEAVE